MANFKKKAVSLFVMLYGYVYMAMAQMPSGTGTADPQVSGAFSTANEQLKGSAGGAITTFQYICGFGALVGGAMLFYKFVNGDNDASKKAGQWVGGLIAFVVVLQMVKVFFFGL